jgi:hypothetical protein
VGFNVPRYVSLSNRACQFGTARREGPHAQHAGGERLRFVDQNTLEPRPNYWATVLWRKLMGRTVLDPQSQPHRIPICMLNASKAGRAG